MQRRTLTDRQLTKRRYPSPAHMAQALKTARYPFKGHRNMAQIMAAEAAKTGATHAR